jgi:hypothetical protein
MLVLEQSRALATATAGRMIDGVLLECASSRSAKS